MLEHGFSTLALEDHFTFLFFFQKKSFNVICLVKATVLFQCFSKTQPFNPSSSCRSQWTFSEPSHPVRTPSLTLRRMNQLWKPPGHTYRYIHSQVLIYKHTNTHTDTMGWESSDPISSFFVSYLFCLHLVGVWILFTLSWEPRLPAFSCQALRGPEVCSTGTELE